MKTLLLAMTIMVLIADVHSQPSSSVRWTGVARNPDGAIIPNDTLGTQVNIVDGTSNTILLSERQEPATDPNGNFYVEVGKGKVISGSWSNLSNAKGPLWMQIAIDPTGGTAYKQLASVPVTRDGTSNTITFGKTYYSAEQKQVESRAKGVRAGTTTNARWTSTLTPFQKSSACGQQLAQLEQQFQASFKTCLDAKMAEFNNAPFVKFAQLCTAAGFVDPAGGPDVNGCLTGYEERMRTQCNASAVPNESTVTAKSAECRKLADELSVACKTAAAQLAELAKERSAVHDRILRAYDAYKSELNALNAINARIATVSSTLTTNACPTEFLVPAQVTSPVAIPTTPSWQEYSGPPIRK